LRLYYVRFFVLVSLISGLASGCAGAAAGSARPSISPTISPTGAAEDNLPPAVVDPGKVTPSLPASTVEVASETPAVMSPTPAPRSTLAPGDWMIMPVIPSVSERAREIYQAGLAKGNDPHAFAKVGDCQNVPSMFLSIFEYGNYYSLGSEYEDLQGTIDWFAGSFSRESEAVRRGFNAASVVSPVWADPDACDPGETPLDCELRLHRPSIAIVSLETWWAGKPENYERYVRQILESLINQGVLPILATKADNQEGNHRINEILAGLAHEYDIPLWNFWRAIQPLPGHGLMEDGFHLTFAPNLFDDPQMMKSAWPWRNLTALQALTAVLQGVSQNLAADS